ERHRQAHQARHDLAAQAVDDAEGQRGHAISPDETTQAAQDDDAEQQQWNHRALPGIHLGTGVDGLHGVAEQLGEHDAGAAVEHEADDAEPQQVLQGPDIANQTAVQGKAARCRTLIRGHGVFAAACRVAMLSRVKPSWATASMARTTDWCVVSASAVMVTGTVLSPAASSRSEERRVGKG